MRVLRAIHIYAQNIDKVDGGGRRLVCLLVKVREVTELEHTPTFFSTVKEIPLGFL